MTSLDPRQKEPHTLDVPAQEEKIAQNIWDHIDDVLKVVKAAQDGVSDRCTCTRCYETNTKIHMRDGGCLIYDRDHKRISPEQLAYQYGREVQPK